MDSRPDSIRNVSWAVVQDGSERRHVYRREVDLHLKNGRIVEITPAGARPTGPGETVLDGRACWPCRAWSTSTPIPRPSPAIAVCARIMACPSSR
jgi:hypothetical protein